MKKFYILFCFVLAGANLFAQFVPTTGAYYTINATQSGVYLAVGPNLSAMALPTAQAALTPVRNDGTQAFTFVPVPDGAGGFKANTYYLQNKWDKYLNNTAANVWDVNFESTINGVKSEWVISGSNPSVQLHSNGGAAATKYLAPATNRMFEYMYCDKTSNNTFNVNAYTAATAPTVSLSAKAFQIEAGETYYLSVASVDNSISSSVTVEAPAGITVSKTSISQSDFAAGNSTVIIGISSTAAQGSTSTINIKDGSTTIATILVKTVAPFARYYIREQSSSLAMGTTSAADSLNKLYTIAISTYQKFYFRKLNVSDVSTPDTVQIVQDGSRRNLRAAYTGSGYTIFSPWSTDLGIIPGLYSTWIRTDGTGFSQFANTIYSGVKYLGGVTAVNANPVYDKTSTTSGTKWVLYSATSPVLEANVTSILFDSNHPSRTFIVTGANLAADVTLTPPAGVALSQSTITVADAQAGKTITATWDGITSVSGSVSFSSTTASASVSLGLFGLDFGKKYYIKESSTGFYFTESGVVNNKAIITDFSGSNEQIFQVIGAYNPDEYLLKNIATGYLAKSNGNNYDTYFYADTTSTSNGFRFQLTKNVDGSYIMKNLAVSGSLGTDATTKGSLVYNDKTSPKVRNWIFQEITSVTSSSNSSGLTFAGGNSANVVVFPGGDLTLDDATRTINSLTIKPGAKVTLNSGKSLTVTSTFAIKSDATGTGTFVNNGTATITSGTVNQYLTSGRNWYVSSPVSAATTSALSTATQVYSYNEPNAQFVTETGSLTPAKGYISATGSTGAITFSGTLNDGDQTVNLTRTYGVSKAGFNLIGNPYPSYIDWEQATRTNVGPTMWYRSKSGGAYTFATYGAVSQVGTMLDGVEVTKLIPPMQGFWVRVDAPVLAHDTTGTVIFNNGMRSHSGATSTLLKAPAATTNTQQVLRLQVSNGVNSDEAIVLFNGNATNVLDDYDSPKMSNNNAAVPEIYTKAGSENLVINGLNSVETANIIALGFTSGQTNTFVIKATQVSNFDGTSIYLHDNQLGIDTELSSGESYSFTSDATTTDSRFTVVFKSASAPTGLNNASLSDVHVSGKEGRIVISSSEGFGTTDQVSVYNCVGQKLINAPLTRSTTILNSFSAGVYVVILNVNGESRTEKVIVK